MYCTQYSPLRQALFILFPIHSIQLFLLIFLIAPLLNRLPNLLHHMIIKIQVMQHAQAHSQHFFCFQQMPDIRAAVGTAGRTLAAFFNRALIGLITLIEQIELSMVRIDVAGSAVSGRVYAVEKVHAALHPFQYIFRCADCFYNLFYINMVVPLIDNTNM